MTTAQLKKSFELYLSNTKRLSSRSVKNYLSDWHHFWQWLTLVLTSRNKIKNQNWTSADLIINSITPSILNRYKIYLSTNNIAKSTVKRRLATVRIFCQFCLDQQWLKQNPALGLKNPSPIEPKEKEINDLLSKFGAYLKQHGASKNTIKNYVADVRAYLLAELTNEL